jgi:NADPH-dependent glutamate synthase beta subunit-like oxidoreductase/Pyruvate/2-oxoacid:ferredoxin oxidoreductase delta subunit
MSPFLTDAQLRVELWKCQSCEARPCRGGCPAGCSPADFIMAARCGEPSDYRRAAALILANNPLGGVCGSVCPDSLCMARCSRRGLDAAVNIPGIQAALLHRARALGVLPRFETLPATGQRVAVVGAGPAGLGAASVLAKAGHTVHVFDRADRPGGMARLVPRHRLDPEVLEDDIAWLLGLGDVRLVLGKPVALPRDLLARGFAAVIVAAGLGEPAELDVPGSERAFHWTQVLGSRPPALRGKRVAVIGDGAVAVDCAGAALAQEAAHVELFARKKLSELELTLQERDRLFTSGVHVSCRVRVTAIRGRGRGRAARVTGLALRKVELPASQTFHPSRLTDLPFGEHERRDFNAVILATGGRSGLRLEPHPRIVYAGDLEDGPTSIVEALASGKRAGHAVHKLLSGDDLAPCPDRASCPGGSGCPKGATCSEWNRQAPANGSSGGARAPAGLPVPLETDFLGRQLASPFLLAPGPYTAGYAQLRKAYDAGWAGGVMEAAPEAPADALDRLRGDVERLRREFPDRLTLTSSEGAATDDPTDYRAAAALLARGARAVLIGRLANRHGLDILRELHAGLSHLLAERGLRSVSELVGSAPAGLAAPVGAQVGAKAEVDPALCTSCGNCSRCPWLAIALDAKGVPVVDPARCVGCALCVEQCFAGALSLPSSQPRSTLG